MNRTLHQRPMFPLFQTNIQSTRATALAPIHSQTVTPKYTLPNSHSQTHTRKHLLPNIHSQTFTPTHTLLKHSLSNIHSKHSLPDIHSQTFTPKLPNIYSQTFLHVGHTSSSPVTSAPHLQPLCVLRIYLLVECVPEWLIVGIVLS